MSQDSGPEDYGFFDVLALAKALPETAQTMLADRYLTDGDAASVRIFRVCRSVPALYHVHCDEHLYIIPGKGSFWMDDPSSERVLGVGELVVFPRKTVHAIPRIVEEPLVFMSIDTPRRIPTASGVEDPERKPAVAAGYRGGRFISVEASTRGEWEAGGSTMAGADGYATSKQCVLAAALALARENPRLHINAVEPGFTPATNLAREAPAPVRFVSKYILTLFAPFVKYWSTPKRAARVITSILTSKLDQTGTYYDDGGQPMLGSVLARDPSFGFRVVTETRALLSTEQLA